MGSGIFRFIPREINFWQCVAVRKARLPKDIRQGKQRSKLPRRPSTPGWNALPAEKTLRVNRQSIVEPARKPRRLLARKAAGFAPPPVARRLQRLARRCESWSRLLAPERSRMNRLMELQALARRFCERSADNLRLYVFRNGRIAPADQNCHTHTFPGPRLNGRLSPSCRA